MAAMQTDHYQTAGLVLLLAAMLFLTLAFLGRGGSLSPVLIVSAMGLFLTGILILTFSRGESPDATVAGLLPVQHQLNTASLLSRAGCRDAALFIPAPEREGTVGQFHALPPWTPGVPDAGAGSYQHQGRPGILLPPAALPLLKDLENRFRLRVPDGADAIGQVMQEVGEDCLGIASGVSAVVDAEEIRVDLVRFALYPACRYVRGISPDACLLNPCTVCSLLACLAVRSTGRECRIASVTLDDRTESVHLVLTFAPPVPAEPAVAVVEPVTPINEEPSVAVVEPVSSVPEEPAVAVVEEPAPVVAAEPVTMIPAEPAISIPEEPENPVWWSRHPGSQRFRYLRMDESVIPIPKERVLSVPEERAVPVAEPAAPTPVEAPVAVAEPVMTLPVESTGVVAEPVVPVPEEPVAPTVEPAAPVQKEPAVTAVEPAAPVPEESAVPVPEEPAPSGTRKKRRSRTTRKKQSAVVEEGVPPGTRKKRRPSGP